MGIHGSQAKWRIFVFLPHGERWYWWHPWQRAGGQETISTVREDGGSVGVGQHMTVDIKVLLRGLSCTSRATGVFVLAYKRVSQWASKFGAEFPKWPPNESHSRVYFNVSNLFAWRGFSVGFGKEEEKNK